MAISQSDYERLFGSNKSTKTKQEYNLAESVLVLAGERIVTGKQPSKNS